MGKKENETHDILYFFFLKNVIYYNLWRIKRNIKSEIKDFYSKVGYDGGYIKIQIFYLIFYILLSTLSIIPCHVFFFFFNKIIKI